MGCIQSRSSPQDIGEEESSVRFHPQAKECKEIRISKRIVLWNQYLVIRFIGSGVSGKVYVCLDIRTHDLVAVKCVLGTSVPKEAQYLLSLENSANIVRLKEILYDLSSSYMLIVMEYLCGGPVFGRNQMNLGYPVPEDVARFYVRDIVRGVMALHTNGIIHGDLKLENALLSSCGSIGLIDLGSSKECTLEKGTDFISSRKGGTPAFQSPEILLRTGPYSGTAADIYALGTCLYILLFSKTPYEAGDISDLLNLMKQGNITIPAHPRVSRNAVSLVKGLLESDPHTRLKLQEILKHNWITDNGRLAPVSIEQEATIFEPCNFESFFSIGDSISSYTLGDYICTQGEPSNGCVGVVVEGTCDIFSRGGMADIASQQSVLELQSRDDCFSSVPHGSSSSSSSSSAYDILGNERMRKEVTNLDREIDMALERLEQIRVRSMRHGGQEEFLVERNATLIGEVVLQQSLLPPDIHPYSSIASSQHTKILWIPAKSFHMSMSTSATLHHTVTCIRCRRQSTLDTISGLCLVRDMIL